MNHFQKRVILILILLSIPAGLLFLQLVRLQVIERQSLNQKRIQQSQQIIAIPGRKGNIFDRNGTLLVTNIDSYALYAVPPRVENAAGTAAFLSRIIQTDELKLKEKLTSPTQFVWLARQLTKTQKDLIKDQKITGLYFIENTRRIYLKNKLAGQVLGFTGIDNQGLSGIEFAYDKILSGKDGFLVIEQDATGREMYYANRILKEPINGQDIKLTLDETLQYFSEKYLKKAIDRHQANSGCVLIQDVQTGEILAMASYPFLNPNIFLNTPEMNRKNLAIQKVYEPGSTLKLATVGTALDLGMVNPDTKYQNEETLKVGEHTIHEAERIKDPNSQKTIAEIIIESINVGSAKLGQRIGKENLFKNFKKFGFSVRTGIALPGEEAGLFNDPQKWKDVEQATIPFGQGIGITPIQLISYVSAIGNDGYWQTPKIISKINDNDPKIKYTRKKILESKTAWQLRTMMQDVVRKGSGVAAAIPGYSIGGKTGTAQKINPSTGRYDTQNYISSFVGLAPLKRPKIAILVVIDSPQRDYYGGVVAAPVFKDIAQTALRVLNVGPDEL